MNYEELKQKIRTMRPRTVFYRVLKAELKAMGHWKDNQRGNPAAGRLAQIEQRAKDVD